MYEFEIRAGILLIELVSWDANLIMTTLDMRLTDHSQTLDHQVDDRNPSGRSGEAVDPFWGLMNETCLPIMGTTWDDLEVVTQAPDNNEFKQLGVRLTSCLLMITTGCAAGSVITVLATSGWDGTMMRWNTNTTSRILVALVFFIFYGIISGAMNYIHIQDLFASHPVIRCLRGCLLTYIACGLAGVLTILDFFLALWYTIPGYPT
ncbi:hypothetical protein BDR07DRAFT_1376926 [Suillus spraguei]|nr:hypothetical protein BDR07DRAFT_1376926 [Suillus spraguei]